MSLGYIGMSHDFPVVGIETNGGFQLVMGVPPKCLVYFMENPTKNIDDLGIAL